ncbi:unnamed protein product [Cladocopium goreaui]|uniref:Platelet-activating factor acetylhydrolase IB subunit alpha1 (PAF acetylhydrolase 29 kDa subunit) (PAF-A H 29 kDa subunit) (PAF-AH subunit gamma) (PAFAH subunit gamma) n=1 Tax=Cladocopium goreaui TaxID=2562237 RepID=A0A9P1M695_9DINO|nr:unnamed protein product [Cladocopium goreaui]
MCAVKQLKAWAMQLFFAWARLCEGCYGRHMAVAAERTAAQLAGPSAVVLVGSSKITLWKTMKEDLAPFEPLNCGFGGARSKDLLEFMPKLVLKHSPRLVVYYCGINDLHFGAEVEVPVANLRRFAENLREAMPTAKLLVLAMNQAPLHFALGLEEKIRRCNQLMHNLSVELGFEFLDLFVQEPRFAWDTDLYAWDMLHLNREGYAILGNLLRPHLAERMLRYLLVYPGNSIGFAASALSVHFEDSRVTCRNDAFEPCPKSQVLKDEELLPYACQGERCSAQECCTDAGTCSEFLNGTGLNASVSTGCADGFVAMQSPPEFCAGPQCQNYDCCLRTAEAMATVQSTATTWDSIQAIQS